MLAVPAPESVTQPQPALIIKCSAYQFGSRDLGQQRSAKMQASGCKVVNLSQRKLSRQLGVSRGTLERPFNDLVDAWAPFQQGRHAGREIQNASSYRLD